MNNNFGYEMKVIVYSIKIVSNVFFFAIFCVNSTCFKSFFLLFSSFENHRNNNMNMGGGPMNMGNPQMGMGGSMQGMGGGMSPQQMMMMQQVNFLS